ncbi:lipopolysaccharide biosynthesis protein [Aeromonas sp. sif2433]|uniref:lipopolysaccharide biosynthesis protein n=1 Tax=Aeromonas sp. sif2433 TaxID=2854794 RepID=UPI001C455991|nr:oligosaccharide flippase family protein [Aeromonas sp. sif2433]MBV7413743.1 oligosaccharide flippase family protein [Aeromonas sp. sif2433]
MGLLRRSSIYLLSNVLNAVIPFLLLPVLTRYLNPDEYGQIAMFQLLVTGLAALTGLNAVGAANRKFYDSSDESLLALFNGVCVHILLLSTFFLAIISFLLSEQLSQWLNIPESWIYFAVVISAANFIIQFRLGQWQIRERAISFGIMQVSQSILVLILSLGLIIGLQQGASGRVDALMVTSIVYAGLGLLLLYRDRLLILLPLKKEFFKEALSFGVPLVPHVVGIFLLSSVDRFFINQQLGVAEAGIYMLAVQLSLGMAVVFDAINKALVPWLFRALAENNPQQLQRLVKFTYLFFIIVFGLGCLSFIVGPWVIRWVAGEEYQRASTVIGWLCLGQAFGGMYLMVTNYIFYAKKTGTLSIITISTGFLNIALLVYFIESKGITGVAMAFSLSMCIRFIATWWLASRVRLVSWSIIDKT